MKNKEALIEYGKNLLIALLFVSALVLLFKAMLFKPAQILESISSFLGAESAGSGTESGQEELVSSAASPCFILATTEDGSHYTAKYDAENKDKLFSQFSSYLGEALGSADAPVQINETQWQQALGQSGVFFDYLYPQPLSSMVSWLGATLSSSAGEHTARRLFLGDNGGVLCLYFIDAEDYAIYRCATALSFSTLSAKIAELPIGSAAFAFELGEEYESIDPYFILSDETAQLRAMSASNPLTNGYSAQELLALFEMNGRTTSIYTESDGSAVFVDGDKSMRVDISGALSFSVAEGRGISIPRSSERLTLQDCISLVGSIVQKSIGENCGDATVGLSGISNGSISGGCTLYFSYLIDGIPVQLPGGADAVRAQISSGSLVRMDMLYRCYTHTGETLLPMPEKQVCAIAAVTGGEPLLRYEDTGDGIICQWVKNR